MRGAGRVCLLAGALPVLGGLAALPTPAHALSPVVPNSLARMDRVTTVGAAGGWRAWSESFDGRYQLVLRSPKGKLTAPAATSRGVPFDLDLGRDAKGRVVAAFSRCAREPTLVGGANASAIPRYSTFRTGAPGGVVSSAAVDGATLLIGETEAPDGVGHATGTTTVRALDVGPFSTRSPLEFCSG